jgi:MFS family permease
MADRTGLNDMRERPDPGRRPRPLLAAFQRPYFGQALASGALWNVSRWMTLFLAAFLAADLTDSPLQVQLVGAAFYGPFLFGAVGGVISDRYDRRLVIVVYLLILTPVTLGMAVLILAGEIRLWMLYPFGFFAGFGWILDLTARRALIADLVGDDLVMNAFSLEAASASVGGIVGALGGGAIVGLAGVGEAFVAMAVLQTGALLLMLRVPSPRVTHHNATSWRDDLRQGIALLPRHRALVSILGVTVIFNLFYFTFVALIPERAEVLGVGAFGTGVLSGASTIGATCAAVAVASLAHPARGRLYVFGAALALAALPVFALVDLYAVALLALIIGGLGVGGFVTMQVTLVATAVEDEARGRALGLLSTAIGVLPIGTIVLGLVAEGIGQGPAIAGSAVAGMLALILWLSRWPEALRL